MARVPTLKTRDVLPGAGGPLSSTEFISSGTGRALARVGDKVQEVGDVTLAFALKQKEEDDKREAAKLDVEYSSFLRQLTYGDETGGGFLNTQGENAITGFADTEAALLKKREELFKGASNPQVKELFKNASEARVARSMEMYMNHVAKQRGEANDAVDKARAQEAADNAAASWSNEKIVTQSVVVAEEAARSQAERQGLSPEATESFVEKARTKVLNQAINGAIVQDPNAARDLYNKYELDIDGSERPAIQQRINVAMRQELQRREALERAQARAKEREYKENSRLATIGVAKGEIGRRELLVLLQENKINESQYKAGLAFHQKRNEEDTDPATYNDLRIKILRGGSSMEEIREIDSISFADRGKLIDLIDQVQRRGGVLAREDVKKGAQAIEIAIAGPEGYKDTMDLSEKLRLSGALTSYYDRVQAGQSAAEAREKIFEEFLPKNYSTKDKLFAAGRSPYWQGSFSGTRDELNRRLRNAYQALKANKDNMDPTEYRIQVQKLSRYKDIISDMESR